MVKLTILGSGTDASELPGIPNRYPPGYLVEFGKEKLLFECSEGIRFRLEKAGIDYTSIKHLAISHSHPDHYELPEFLQSVWNNLQWSHRLKKLHHLTIYCPEQIAKQYYKLWHNYQPVFPHGLPQPKLQFVAMPKTRSVKVGSAKLIAKKVKHGFGKQDCLAFRLEFPSLFPSPRSGEGASVTGRGEGAILAYSGDTGICKGVLEAARNADIFICEASAQIGDKKSAKNYGHLSPRDAGAIAKKAGVKKLILVHYIGLDSDKKMIADCRASGFMGKIIIGKDFQRFKI